nr:MAG TPA: hypothetical protein [Caudoviricetes sp.]
MTSSAVIFLAILLISFIFLIQMSISSWSKYSVGFFQPFPQSHFMYSVPDMIFLLS